MASPPRQAARQRRESSPGPKGTVIGEAGERGGIVKAADFNREKERKTLVSAFVCVWLSKSSVLQDRAEGGDVSECTDRSVILE